MANTRIAPHVILQNAYDPTTGRLKMDGSLTVSGSGNIINFDFDYYEINYLTSGFGTGEPGTIVYKTGGEFGVVVGTIQYQYDSLNRVSKVSRL